MTASQLSTLIPGAIFDLPDLQFYEVVDEGSRKVLRAETDWGIPKICPDCGATLHVHSKKSVSMPHTPFGRKAVVLELHKIRKKCPSCGRLFSCPPLPYIVEGRHITVPLKDYLVKTLCSELSFLKVQELCGISDSSAQRIFDDYVTEMTRTHRFPLPHSLGLDEVQIGNVFRTTVTDLNHRTMIELLERRDGNYLKEFFESNYTAEERSNVRWVCTDMYRPFEKPLGQLFPNAEWLIDHFHVVRYANEAVDIIRKDLQKKLDNPALKLGIKKRLRYILLKRRASLEPIDILKIRAVSALVPEILKAYDIKEAFYEIYDEGNKLDAQAAFERWEASLPKESLWEPFHRIARMVRNFYDPIFRYWDANGLTNAYTESANRSIREIDRRARGLRFKFLRGMILYNPTALAKGSVGGTSYGASLDYIVEETQTEDNSPDNEIDDEAENDQILVEPIDDEFLDKEDHHTQPQPSNDRLVAAVGSINLD
ncbi:MAG: ISL3 family transposase [Sutterellaceae bacterium]|nr:ISL3 family transposase [Sutterellaceae bacterium]